MCGRYNLRLTSAELQQVFELFRKPEWQPRYNIAPSQQVLAIRFEDNASPREPVLFRWGYLAPWAKDEKAKPQPINAMAEKMTGRMWALSFKQQRCLIPATGFYEWQTRPGENKQPFHITVGDDEPFAFAGLWSRWDKGGVPIESCAIITTTANEAVADIHQRMPVILEREDYDRWLDPGSSPEDLLTLLKPFEGPMNTTPISTRVNNVRNESPDLLSEIGS